MKNLSDLKNIQKAIQSAVQAKLDLVKMEDILLERPPISIQQRLAIYQESYEARLEESLSDDFERVQEQLNSPKHFEKIMQAFILQCPSTFRNIAEYSEDFVAFIKKNNPHLYDSALCDWYALVAAKMPDISVGHIVSVQEVQEGKPFQLKIFFSTIPFKSEKKYYTTLRKQDEIKIKEISLEDYELLQFLTSAQSVEDFIEKAQSLKLEDSQVANKINEWITQQVIFCERV